MNKAWITIPSNCDLANIKVVTGDVSKPYNPSHIMCESNDTHSIQLLENFVCDFKSVLEENYTHSQSDGWQPTEGSEVHWLTTTYSSWIRSIHLKSSKNAVLQSKYKYNCYKTEEEVNALLEKIETLIKGYGI